MTTIGVFAAVFDAAGHVLCVRHCYGDKDWGMPGGRMEAGEDPVSAVKREVLEETGVVIDVRSFVGVYSAPYKDDLVILFAAGMRGRRAWSPTGEISDIGFYPLDALPEPMAANPRARFRDVAANVTGVVRTFLAPGLVSTDP